MKTRNVERIVPDTSTYVEIALEAGVHHFRIPSAIAGARLLKAADSRHIAVLASLSDLGDDPLQVLAAARAAGPELLGVAGYAIGISWFHRTLDLDTVVSVDDPMGTGEAVLEELHEAGYRLGDVVLCALLVIKEFMARNAISQAVLERASFFGQLKGQRSFGSSTSTSTSSGGSAGEPSTN